MGLGTIPKTASLPQAIHAIWAANAALAAAVPADRFITGRVPGSEEMPYVRLELESGGNIQRSRQSQYQKQVCTFHVWTDTFDAGDAIVPAIRAAFANEEFDWGTGGVTDFRQEGTAGTSQVSTPEYKAWETVVTFAASTWETRVDV